MAQMTRFGARKCLLGVLLICKNVCEAKFPEKAYKRSREGKIPDKTKKAKNF
jgi:hypothetical protein